MDSFKRSQYSIFKKDEKIAKAPKEELSLDKKEEPKKTILKTNVLGEKTRIEKQKVINFIIWLFGLTLFAIFFFSIGYYLQSRSANVGGDNAVETKDLGQILADKFDKEEAVTSGSVKIEIWIDQNGDGEKNNWETNRDTVSANVRKKGEERPFIFTEADGEGIIRISGLDDGEFEINYFINPNPRTYQGQRDFYGQKLYEIFESTDGSSGLIANEWRDLKVDKDGTKITLGLKEYKPEKLVITRSRYQALFYDASRGVQFASSSNWNNSSLPSKFEIRDDNFFFIKDGSLYKNNPLVNMTYSQKIYDNIAMTDDSFYELSPSGTAIIYGDSNGAYFQTPSDQCGRQSLRYENQIIKLYSQSNPHDTVGVRFGDDRRAIVYGQVGSEEYGYFLASCDNSQMSVKRLPITRYWYGGIFAKHDRFVLKGPITHRPSCIQENEDGPELCEMVRTGEGLYVYLLNEDKLERIGGDELNTTYFVADAFDGRYAILANTEEDPVKILNFDSKDEVKILNFDIAPLFKKYDRHGLSNGQFTYLGEDKFLLLDRFGQCGKGEDCAAIKQFTVRDTNIDVKDVTTIKDIYPISIVGEINK